ncbi:HAD hydrolase-like protein [Jannaschia sp. Os4]|uniref:HAD-IIA family hydrolase n=1 Tax=Jannaschia sp. Os4 TaxID=2807617 RepID=UPI0031B58DB6
MDLVAAYEAVRPRLPPATAGGACEEVADLAALADRFDTFLLDAFGVLNVGETAIPGAAGRMADLRARGKRLVIVSNAAGLPHAKLMEKYDRLGMGFAPEDVVTSRHALLHALRAEPPRLWGVMADPAWPLDGFGRTIFLEDDPAPYAAAEGFLLVGAARWTERRQALLEDALRERPRPVLCGNPDLAAPREGGPSREPGLWAHRLADRTGVEPTFYGKPFRAIYDLAFARVPDPGRVVMVGDSPHTDILGAQVAGVASALITGHGILRGGDWRAAVEATSLRPDFVMPDP